PRRNRSSTLRHSLFSSRPQPHGPLTLLPDIKRPSLQPRSAAPTCQSTSKLMRMFTRHSFTPPSLSVETLMSLIQAPLMFLTVLPAFSNPCRTASSIPLEDDALSSMTLVTDMLVLLAGFGTPMIRVYTYCPTV